MKRLPLILLLSGASLLPISAGPINFNSWYEFSFFDVGMPAMGCFPADPNAPECIPSSGTPTIFADAPPWTFVAGSTSVVLTVTDAFFHGDAFQVFDFGAMIGMTVPAVPADFVSCGDDPVPCLNDPLTSKGMFSLGPGPHSITISPYASPYGAGSAYFLVAGENIPEPGPLWLVGIIVAAGALRGPKHPLLFRI